MIGGDGDAAPFVSMRDEFEQDAGLGLILADRRKVVESNKVELIQLFEGVDQSKFPPRGLKPLNDVDGAREQNPLSRVDQRVADRRHSVAIARVAFAEQRQIIAVRDSVCAGAERQTLLFSQLRRGVEIEAGEGFARRRLGLLAMTLDAARGALGDLDLHQSGDGSLRRPAFAIGGLGDAPPIAREAGQAQLRQQAGEEGWIGHGRVRHGRAWRAQGASRS